MVEKVSWSETQLENSQNKKITRISEDVVSYLFRLCLNKKSLYRSLKSSTPGERAIA